ncbi:MAG: glutathione peroxidase, partial [Sphingomonadaceae bacterium]|nr:glutathione peroxidase [Sphingomonadaceae bacterium]
MDDATIHEVEFDLIDGTRTSFGALGDRVVQVVNTASECGFTPQYDGLEALYQEYRDRGLVVVGFPSDDFGGQEPGSAAEIAEFCRVNHGVTFPLAAKVRVKEGPEQSPVYRFLGKASGSLPAWNFGKYLVGRDGR